MGDDVLGIYLNIITPAFLVRILPKVFQEVVELDEMGEIEEFGEFLQNVSGEFPQGLPDTVPFEIGYENVEQGVKLRFRADGTAMRGGLQQYMRMWIGYKQYRVGILLRLAISLEGNAETSAWTAALIEVGLPTGRAFTFHVKVVEAVFVERAE